MTVFSKGVHERKEEMFLMAQSMGCSSIFILVKDFKPWYCKYFFSSFYFHYTIDSMPNGTLGGRFDFVFTGKALICDP